METTNPERLRLSFLGNMAVSYGEQPLPNLHSRKAEASLCYLAVTGHCHQRPVLASLLWGDYPEDSALTNLRGALAKLRRHISDHLIITRTELCFNSQQPHWLDVAEFEGLSAGREQTLSLM
jgi:DNA-binding SARP family transcriptional activator